MIRLFLIFVLAAMAQDLSQQGARAMRESRSPTLSGSIERCLKAHGRSGSAFESRLALHSLESTNKPSPEFDLYLKANPRPGPTHLLAGVARLKLDRACEAIPVLEKARQWQAGARVLWSWATPIRAANDSRTPPAPTAKPLVSHRRWCA